MPPGRSLGAGRVPWRWGARPSPRRLEAKPDHLSNPGSILHLPFSTAGPHLPHVGSARSRGRLDRWCPATAPESVAPRRGSGRVVPLRPPLRTGRPRIIVSHTAPRRSPRRRPAVLRCRRPDARPGLPIRPQHHPRILPRPGPFRGPFTTTLIGAQNAVPKALVRNLFTFLFRSSPGRGRTGRRRFKWPFVTVKSYK